ncbi:hypothetical protein JW756_05555 [Candidatus Woesearchaeota archaeon]|nr:hypothetical protein [Candidatus Woesearchaeota archaeon]
MNFEKAITLGDARKVPVDILRAKNITLSSKQAIATAKTIILTKESAKSIFRELYEGLREYCDALGYIKGYKFQTHECIAFFIREILKEEVLANKFDRYRKLRNGINYYGETIEEETVKEALKEIPELVRKLEKHV